MAMPSSTAIVLNPWPPRRPWSPRRPRAPMSPVHVARHELRERAGDGDDRLAEVVVGHPKSPATGRAPATCCGRGWRDRYWGTWRGYCGPSASAPTPFPCPTPCSSVRWDHNSRASDPTNRTGRVGDAGGPGPSRRRGDAGDELGLRPSISDPARCFRHLNRTPTPTRGCSGRPQRSARRDCAEAHRLPRRATGADHTTPSTIMAGEQRTGWPGS